MSRSAKVGVVVGIAVLALVLVLLEYGLTANSEKVLATLPSTTRAVLRVDVQAIPDDESARILFEWFVPPERLSDIENECGLDPPVAVRDLIVWVGGPEGEPFQHIGLLLQGRGADAETLAQCYQTLVRGRGSSIEQVVAPTGPLLVSRDGQSAFARVDGDTVVTGSTETVAQFLAVDRRDGPSLRDDSLFRNTWSHVTPGAAIAAAFIAPPRWQAALERLGAVGPRASALEGVEALGLTTRSDKPRSVTIVLDVATAEMARRNAILIEAWALSPPETFRQPWSDIVTSARFTVDGNRITIRADISDLAIHR